jgi:hypothetical protein
LRQDGERCAGGRRYRITIANTGLALRGFGETRPRTAVLVDDSAREQVADRLARGGLVGREQVIEAQVLSDDDDQMLDRLSPWLAARRAAP